MKIQSNFALKKENRENFPKSNRFDNKLNSCKN